MFDLTGVTRLGFAEPPPEVVKPAHVLWRVPHDPEIFAKKLGRGFGQFYDPEKTWDWRVKAKTGYPEVFWVNKEDDRRFPLDEAWQRLSFALIEEIEPLKWREVYDDWRAFMNGTGFCHLPQSDPNYKPRRDYINRIDLGAEALPEWDKVRLIGGATVSGELVDGKIWIDTLDYANPPTLEWLRARPWFFMQAVSIDCRRTNDGTIMEPRVPVIDPFPQSRKPVWIPLVSNSRVWVPADCLIRTDVVVDPLKVF